MLSMLYCLQKHKVTDCFHFEQRYKTVLLNEKLAHKFEPKVR